MGKPKNKATKTKTLEDVLTGFAAGSFSNAADHKVNRKANYIVKHFFKQGHTGMVVAPPAAGKTAIISSFCSHIAQGKSFAGTKVRRSVVYYLAAEDPEGVKDRAYPYLHEAPSASTPFVVVEKCPNFLDPSHIDGIIEDVRNYKKFADTKGAMVVVDTTNLAIGDADENSSTAMGRVISNGEAIAKAANCYVLFVHHTSHSNEGRARGSSAFEGNTHDTFILKRSSDGFVSLVPKKQKNTKLQDPLHFEIETLDVAFDDEGDMITVPKAVPLHQSKSSLIAANSRKPPRGKSKANQRSEELLRVLNDLSTVDANAWHNSASLRNIVGEPFNDVRDVPENLRKAVSSGLSDLLKAGKIEEENKSYRLQCP
ncbi:AAA family ATPase [Shimia sp. MIT1388]|uniref:AAA family ATPase n=1 Tax=Shimia sp. MIT1388 TaxID=3096992 RepID=UPI00399B9CC3